MALERHEQDAASRRPASLRGKARSQSGADPQASPDIAYKWLFEQASDAILISDAKGRYIDANPAACELTGYTLKELRRMVVGDLAPAEERPYAARRFRALRDVTRTWSERVLLRKDGAQIPVEAHAGDLGNGMFQTTLRDISQRVEAQKEAQRATAAFRSLVELCHVTVISADAEGRIISWNPAATALFGYSQGEILGKPVTMLIPPRLRSRHEPSFRRHVGVHHEKPFNRTLETHGLKKDGTEFPLEVSLTVWQQDDRPMFYAFVRDLTEHRRVVEELNDALQLLRFHVERMPLAYVVWDKDFRVVEWNPAAERVFGYSKKEALGRHPYELIVPPDEQSAIDVVWDNLLKGDTSSHSINDNVRKNGTRMTCEWFNTPLRDSAGRIYGVASMAMDVSEREAMQAQVRNAQKLESLAVLTSGIAHDFNSSLMVILGNAALLRSTKGLPVGATQHLELIEDAGARANELVRHLLLYARKGRHNPQPTDLNAVIRDVVAFVRSSVGKKHEVKLSLASRLPMVLADSSQMEQIILNLCLNAKQAMAAGGKIGVTTRQMTLTAAKAAKCVPNDAKPGTYVELEVSDTGCGMDEATRARIFDPFFTTKANGHGLGLAGVMGIMRQHRAVALVESKPAAGTKVHIFIPAHHGDAKTSRRGRARH